MLTLLKRQLRTPCSSHPVIEIPQLKLGILGVSRLEAFKLNIDPLVLLLHSPLASLNLSKDYSLLVKALLFIKPKCTILLFTLGNFITTLLSRNKGNLKAKKLLYRYRFG